MKNVSIGKFKKSFQVKTKKELNSDSNSILMWFQVHVWSILLCFKFNAINVSNENIHNSRKRETGLHHQGEDVN